MANSSVQKIGRLIKVKQFVSFRSWLAAHIDR